MKLEEICKQIDAVGREQDFGSEFLVQSREYWKAKAILFPEAGIEVDTTPEEKTAYTEKYPLMATFRGSFKDYKLWYSEFCMKEIETCFGRGELHSIGKMRKLKKCLELFMMDDPCIYPYQEEDFGKDSAIIRIGGRMRKVKLYLPDDHFFSLITKQYPPINEGENLYFMESIQKRIAERGHQVAQPERMDKYLLLTYPKLQCNLSEYIQSNSFGQDEIAEIIKTVLQSSFRVSFDFYKAMLGVNKSKEDEEALQIINQNEETGEKVIRRFKENFLIKTQDYLSPKKALSEEAIQTALRYFEPAARELDTLPRYPHHGDLFPGNVLIDRKGQPYLHDFRLGKAPLQKDVFYLLECVGLTEEIKQQLLLEIYQIYRSLGEAANHEVVEKTGQNIPLQNKKEFLRGYSLVRITHGLPKAALMFQLETQRYVK